MICALKAMMPKACSSSSSTRCLSIECRSQKPCWPRSKMGPPGMNSITKTCVPQSSPCTRGTTQQLPAWPQLGKLLDTGSKNEVTP